MNDCCVGRNSRFCPECGERLGQDAPLVSLLMHCKQQHAALVGRMNKIMARYGNDELSPNVTSYIARNKERLAKWASWVDALTTVLGEVPR
jgi:hypothetical protein